MTQYRRVSPGWTHGMRKLDDELNRLDEGDAIRITKRLTGEDTYDRGLYEQTLRFIEVDDEGFGTVWKFEDPLPLDDGTSTTSYEIHHEAHQQGALLKIFDKSADESHYIQAVTIYENDNLVTDTIYRDVNYEDAELADVKERLAKLERFKQRIERMIENERKQYENERKTGSDYKIDDDFKFE